MIEQRGGFLSSWCEREMSHPIRSDYIRFTALMGLLLIAVVVLPLSAQEAQTVSVVLVTSKNVDRVIQLPGEFLPFQSVFLHARVAGYVDEIYVDRGSRVDRGQVLVKLSAPELTAQVAEAESKAEAAEAQKAEAQALLASAQSNYDRLRQASATEGAISGNELIQAEKAVEAANALVRSRESATRAAFASVRAVTQMHQYLEVKAPFDGAVTERFVHPGALVGPNGGDTSSGALVKLEQLSRLRLVVAVPEAAYGGIVTGEQVGFHVPAYPDQAFTAVVSRVAGALEPKSRTMSVELDVANPRRVLAPGMYPEVSWPLKGQGSSLLVPPSSIVTTTERTFVIRVKEGRAEWITVRRGSALGNQIEVFGALSPGDLVVRQGTDEIREGTTLRVRQNEK
jgi:membrane fusion protein (multidrug efflux system)